MRHAILFTAVVGLGFLGGACQEVSGQGMSGQSVSSQSISSHENGGSALAVEIRQQEAIAGHAPASGEAWLKLAVLRQDSARYGEAEQAYRKAIALLKPAGGAALADALDHLGTMYVEQGKLAKAEPLERKALAMREEAQDTLGIGVSHAHLSALLLGRGEFASAEAEATMAVSLLAPESARPAAPTAATPEQQMAALVDLALARCVRGECAGAVPVLRRALRIAHANHAAESVPVGFADFLLGYALWKSGDNTAGGESMKQGTEELATQLGWGHPMYARALGQYQGFLRESGQTAKGRD